MSGPFTGLFGAVGIFGIVVGGTIVGRVVKWGFADGVTDNSRSDLDQTPTWRLSRLAYLSEMRQVERAGHMRQLKDFDTHKDHFRKWIEFGDAEGKKASRKDKEPENWVHVSKVYQPASSPV